MTNDMLTNDLDQLINILGVSEVSMLCGGARTGDSVAWLHGSLEMDAPQKARFDATRLAVQRLRQVHDPAGIRCWFKTRCVTIPKKRYPISPFKAITKGHFDEVRRAANAVVDEYEAN